MTLNFYKYNTELCKTFINEPLAQCAVSFMWRYMNKNLSGHALARALFKKKRKVQLGNSKSGRGRLQE